jgi:hypothetical protein
MNKKIKSMWIASVVIAAAFASQASLIYSNGFEYTTGALTGQDSWVSWLGGTVQVTNGTGVNTSQVLGRSLSSITTNGASKAVSLGLGSYNSGTFSVDFYRGLAGTTTHSMYAGFGSSTNNSSGIALRGTSSNIEFRDGAGTGTSVLLYEAANDSIITAYQAWHRITMNLNFQNNLITGVYIQNLTTPGPATQLYFDSAATVATRTYLVDETFWNTAYIRTGKSTDNVHFIDNMSITAIPEPATIGMLGLGAVITLLIRRKRML